MNNSLNQIQLGISVFLGVVLMAVALALSIDGNTGGSVVVMLLSVMMFVIATIRERLMD